MINIKDGILESKDSNLVLLVEKELDLKILKGLKLEDKILKKINDTIKKAKNSLLDFFIGEKSYEKLYILYFNEGGDENIDDFLGDQFRKLPKNVTICLNNDKNIINLLNAAILGRYKYQEFKTEKEIDKLEFVVSEKSKQIVKDRFKTIKNIVLSRDLSSMPANYLYPESFSKIVKETKFKNTKVKIFDSKEIKKKGLNLLYAVGNGSDNKPQMIILERIIDNKLPTIGLVGKGITFDTGGIQVKPGEHMYDMKGDMSGAADVFAIMKEIDTKKLKVNIVACLVLAENHISGTSYKPSDIIKSYSGKTVDVVHTDAEGRLVLADGISYISDKYKLDKIVSIATLTGACMRALGYRYAGVLGNDEELIGKLLKYSENHSEKYWRLPFDKYFIKKTKGKEADLENINYSVEAGTSIGAAFLSNFLLNNEKFTHIDIAGVAINSYEPYGYFNSGMTGFGVDSLSKILSELK